MLPEFILYSDFACPFCYALEEYLGTLPGETRIAWRGVQPDAGADARPNAMMDVEDLSRATDIAQEVALVQQSWPDLPIIVPRHTPDTRDAIHATAVFSLIDDFRAQTFRQACYRACWRDGLDLADRLVLRTLAERVGLARSAMELLDHPHIAETVALWKRQWEESGVRSLPLLIRRDGAKLSGLVDRERLTRFLDGQDADTSSQHHRMS
ncbi:MAG: DsbA family protein [Nitrospirae bacterium]|nr:DsbA family protein [Nitrospirota bacterium]